MGLAECLRELRRPAEAVMHFQEMLRLNPRDNQGVHFRLLASLLDIDDVPAATALVDKFPDDRSTIWAYGVALLRFRQNGDTSLSRTALGAAFDANYFVPNYLQKKKDFPAILPPMYRPGSEDEAVLCVVELQNAWDKTPGAIYWLTEQKRRRREREERKRRDK
jgi:hypothetical protein